MWKTIIKYNLGEKEESFNNEKDCHNFIVDSWNIIQGQKEGDDLYSEKFSEIEWLKTQTSGIFNYTIIIN